MSFVSANDHLTPVSPEDPLYYAPRSVRRKADPRSNAIQQMQSDDLPPRSRFDRMHEEAFARFTSPPESEFVYQRRRPRALLVTVGGIGAAIAVTAVGAIVFYTVFPKSKSDPPALAVSISTPASATPAPVESEDAQALLQGFMKFQTIRTDNPEHADSEPSSHGPAAEAPEKPQALLEKFIQWQQKK